MTMATPIAITRLKSLFGNNSLAAIDSERFDALERAGFRVERFGDLWKLLSDRLGGHYMDVGASAKIAAGLVSHLVSLVARLSTNHLGRLDKDERRLPGHKLYANWSRICKRQHI